MGNAIGQAIVALFLFLIIVSLVDLGLRLFFNVRWCASGLKKLRGHKLDSLRMPIFLGVTVLVIEIGLTFLLNQLISIKTLLSSGSNYFTLAVAIIILAIFRYISWSTVGLFVAPAKAHQSALVDPGWEMTKWKTIGIIGSFVMDAIAITIGILFLKAFL